MSLPGSTLLDAALAAAGIQDGPRIGIGHSAGGHLAYWAAGRNLLEPSAPGALAPGERSLDGVVSQAGVLDLSQAHRLKLGNDAAFTLMGSTPEQDPVSWRIADPAARDAPGIPLVMLHGSADADVPVSLARSFGARARGNGAEVEYRELDGDHYGLITPGDPAWEVSSAGLAAGAVGELAEAATGLPTGILKFSPRTT